MMNIMDSLVCAGRNVYVVSIYVALLVVPRYCQTT